MPYAIRITAGEVSLQAELNDTATARAIYEKLPLEAAGNRWGEEIYFSIPVQAELAENARTEMEVGELAYWPPGAAFCIFFGPTPASTGKTPCAASPVNPIGRVSGDVESLKSVGDGTIVRVEPA